MDSSGGSDGVPRNLPSPFYPPGPYQTPLFSPHVDWQQLESRRVNLSRSYSTGLSGDQNRATNLAASHATIHQTPPLGHSSYFSPHVNRGDSVDGFTFPPPQRAWLHTLPQQMPPHYPYIQAPSMTGASTTAYDFQSCYNTASYGPPIPPHRPYMQASKTFAPIASDFPGRCNTLSHGSSMPLHCHYAQASTTTDASLPYDFPGCCNTTSHVPTMSPQYLYTQGPPTIGTPLPYNFLGCHGTEVSRGSLGQNSQSFQPVQPVQGSPRDPIDLTQPLHVAPLPLQHGDIDASPKAKKCVRNYPCPAPGCPSFGRPQELRRHLSTHLPHWVSCPSPGCSWRGDRLSVFRKHWGSNHQQNHPSGGQDLDEDRFIIYDPRPFVENIENGTLSIEDAPKQAMAMVSKRASELHKPELSENPWGRKRRRKAQKPE